MSFKNIFSPVTNMNARQLQTFIDFSGIARALADRHEPRLEHHCLGPARRAERLVPAQPVRGGDRRRIMQHNNIRRYDKGYQGGELDQVRGLHTYYL